MTLWIELAFFIQRFTIELCYLFIVSLHPHSPSTGNNNTAAAQANNDSVNETIQLIIDNYCGYFLYGK